ncbi:hypothetical protein [Desulfallas thermosapovorans]|uniref:Uncharacterized protein n=1 Tax=Desulfallas thermosapovorans DSM 6562 TaxID=1121431 RepID=A0A5S4ZW73_9FIRM|nr:hypothetical protein [Desulfallas thermosapovorans]TYO96466.1 hypothetical protein LX24_00933 [Desulfallas thermosapovorans DSM 6562]
MKKPKYLLVLITTLMLLFASVSGVWAQDPAQNSYEGEGFHFISGESFPTAIQVAGYDQKTKRYYLNYTLHTTKDVGVSETATFSYVIEVFDENGAQIGNLGTFDTPETATGEVGSSDASVENSEITIADPGLPAAYRVVITIVETAVA